MPRSLRVDFRCSFSSYPAWSAAKAIFISRFYSFLASRQLCLQEASLTSVQQLIPEVYSMRSRRFVLPLLGVLTLACATFAVPKNASELAVDAVSNDDATSASAIRELREMGPTGLDALFVRYAKEIRAFADTGSEGDDWKRIANALDTVGMQKDNYAAQLYWYTDLEAAKRAAKAQHKPILSLRLLGNLNEEF